MACQVIGLHWVVVLCCHSFEILFRPALTIWWNPYSPSFAIYIESEYLWMQHLYELARKGSESVILSSLTRDCKGGRFFTIARRLHGCDTNCVPISSIYVIQREVGDSNLNWWWCFQEAQPVCFHYENLHIGLQKLGLMSNVDLNEKEKNRTGIDLDSVNRRCC